MNYVQIPNQRHCNDETPPMVSEAVGRYLIRKLGDAQIGQVVRFATELLRDQLGARRFQLSRPAITMDYLRMKLAGSQREVFGAIFLDSQQRVIADEELFIGTLTKASVHPRDVVCAALKNCAASVVLYHNHPSGVPKPSRADELLTQQLKICLHLIDVAVVDHIVVGATSCVSFAERGLI